MSDFELGMLKAIKKTFERGNLQGCYFHFFKHLEKNKKTSFI